jgi:hypothetical protein
MRALITVERHRPDLSPFLLGANAVTLLESLPGVSDIRIEEENTHRATISYRWRDPGVHSQALSATLLSHGMRLV